MNQALKTNNRYEKLKIDTLYREEYSMKKVHLLHPATFKLDGGAMFGIIPKPLWEKKIKPDEQNRILMSLRIMLIQTDDKNILIDTGVGDYHSDKFNHQFEIESELNPIAEILKVNFEITAEEITDIVLTHLHFDHVGGLGTGEKNEAVFKNATLHIHQDHYDYALNSTPRDSGSFQKHFFQPLIEDYDKRKKVKWLNGESGEIIKEANLCYKSSFGHTPHMIHPYDEKFIYMADLVPMAHHIRVPWVMGYDIEPGVTCEFKEKFYDFITENNLTMIFEHDIASWGGTVKKDEKKGYLPNDVLSANGKQFITIS